MRTANLLGDFLRARRGQLTPGESRADGRRRVAGLRRDELAVLAGVSSDYYARLEQGRERHPSPSVVAALARAMRLTDDGRAHLEALVATQSGRPSDATGRQKGGPSAGLLGLMANISHAPVFLVDALCGVLACTSIAVAVHPGLAREPNMLRLMFLDEEERRLYRDWSDAAAESVAWLRASSGADAEQSGLGALVGELSAKSPRFAELWERQDVLVKASGRKRLRHPLVGDLELGYETFSANGQPGQSLIVYHAEPSSASLSRLAALAAETAGGGVVRFDAGPRPLEVKVADIVAAGFA